MYSDVDDLLGGFVEALLSEAGIDRPPVRPALIAEELRLQCCGRRDLPTRGKIVRTRHAAIAVLRPEPRAERSHWTLAHEVGEFLMPHIERHVDVPVDSVSREWLADRFASLLLVPPGWFERDCSIHRFDLPALKELYSTASHEVLARRMLDADVPTIISVFDHGQLKWRLPPVRNRLLPIEIDAQRVVHRDSRPTELSTGPYRAQAWPIHEADWKREIIRTTVDDWGPG